MLRLSRREEDFDHLKNKYIWTLGEFLDFLAEEYKKLSNRVYKDLIIGDLIKEYPLTESFDEIMEEIHESGYEFLIPAFLRAFDMTEGEKFFEILTNALLRDNIQVHDIESLLKDIDRMEFERYLENFIENDETLTFRNACVLLKNMTRSIYFTNAIDKLLHRFKSNFEADPEALFNIALADVDGYMILDDIKEIFGVSMYDRFLMFIPEETTYQHNEYENALFAGIQWMFEYNDYKPNKEFLDDIIDECEPGAIQALLKFYKKRLYGEE